MTRPRPTSRLGAALQDRKGVAAAELALIVPVLILLLLGTVDVAGVLYQRMKLDSAARAGVQYALAFPSDSTGITAATRLALPDWADISVTEAGMTCECAGASAVCGTSCATPMQRFVAVAVSRPFTAQLLPGLSPVSSRVAFRIQ